MRHFISKINETISTVIGVRPNGIVVSDLVTHALRTRDFARSLLLRLTGQVPAYLYVANMRHLQPADVGAVGTSRCYCLSLRRLRPSWRGMKPVCGTSAKKF